MRKLVAFLLIVFTLTMFFAIPVSAKAPSSAWDTGYQNLWCVNSTVWESPGNVAVDDDLNTYYQWFYTYIPFYNKLTYDVPILIYTYDGSLVSGGNPTTRYAIRLSQDSQRTVKVEYIRLNASDAVTVVYSYYFNYMILQGGTVYRNLVAFCGWGMDENGALYFLVEVDGVLDMLRLGSSPNGDRNLYAQPNNFDGLYIMGFNTKQFAALSITEDRVIQCFRYLRELTYQSSVYLSWINLLEKLAGLAPDEQVNHFFNLYSPKSYLDFNYIEVSNRYDPSLPLMQNASNSISYELVREEEVDVFGQGTFEDDGRCVYDIHVNQTIYQYSDNHFYVDYSIVITGNNPDALGSDYSVLAYAQTFESQTLLERIKGVTFRPGTCQYPLVTTYEEYSDPGSSGVIYQATQNLDFSVTYEYLKSANFNLYMVSDLSNWGDLSNRIDYLDNYQKSFVDKYQDYINSVFAERIHIDLELSGFEIITDRLFSIPGLLYLVSICASFCIVKVVLF